VIATIPVGDAPQALVWNSTNNKVYCANEHSFSVTVIRDVTGIEVRFTDITDSKEGVSNG
jgi:DNA-binding beta-propeller fold protein YncE